MKKIVIYGAGGFARELAIHIEEMNQVNEEWEILGFLEDNSNKIGKMLNGYPILGGVDWLDNWKRNDIYIVLGIGSPSGKKVMYEKVKSKGNYNYPNLIHPSVKISEYNCFGQGIIVCKGSIITCNTDIKDFVTININSTIGHDTIIENYTTISPNCSISGNVHLSDGVYLGTQATIIEKLSVGRNSIIGAGAVVVKDIPDFCTAVGVPAKPIKVNNNNGK